MERIIFKPEEVRRLYPIQPEINLKYVFSLIHRVRVGKRNPLHRPILLRRYDANMVVLDGTHKSVAAILSDSNLIGIVLETFEEAMTKNAQGSFDCAPADVAELRRYGIYYLNNLFYTPETKQQAENLEQMLRRARSPKVIEMLFRGLESYLGFIKRNSSAP